MFVGINLRKLSVECIKSCNYPVCCRVVARGEVKEVCNYTFHGFGAHSSEYPCNYLTAAAAVGMTQNDVDMFVKRLDKVMSKCMSSGANVNGDASLSLNHIPNGSSGKEECEENGEVAVASDIDDKLGKVTLDEN